MHTQLAYHTAIAQLDERRRAGRRHPDAALTVGRPPLLRHLRRVERPGRARRPVTRLGAGHKGIAGPRRAIEAATHARDGLSG